MGLVLEAVKILSGFVVVVVVVVVVVLVVVGAVVFSVVVVIFDGLVVLLVVVEVVEVVVVVVVVVDGLVVLVKVVDRISVRSISESEVACSSGLYVLLVGPGSPGVVLDISVARWVVLTPSWNPEFLALTPAVLL